MSSVKKEPIDLNVMDFKQMFDSEELSICLNAMYEADVQDDMLALIFEANKTTYFAVKTPNEVTEKTTVTNKILQGDVLAPLLSSNMVDRHIGLSAMNTNNVYLYKNKVKIPPLTMQDDTIGISTCGFRSAKMNSFMNTRSNIMSLQFGRDKCEKMHVGKKKRNVDICVNGRVDAWKDKIIKDNLGNDKLVDEYIGKEIIKSVEEKMYLGNIIQSNGKNEKNIQAKINKAVGSVENIISAITERPYGCHTFKAALLMRQGLMLGGMLTNAEAWINVTETDIKRLTMPDTMSHRKLLSTYGNPSRVFMSLELGVVPVKFVLMAKRTNMLHYILNENTNSTMRQVFEELKIDSRKGDSCSLVQKDLKDLDIDVNETAIENYSKSQWKIIVKNAVRKSAFNYLSSENLLLKNTKEIFFEELKTSEYLLDNRNTALSKIIFSLRSKTFDIMDWQQWKYFDNLCVACEVKKETMTHLLKCSSYENVPCENKWEEIKRSNKERQFEIAQKASTRQKLRRQIIDKFGAGHPLNPPGSRAPGSC